MDTLIIDRRFRGPPDSGNGGYVAGILAREFGGSNCEVTLLRPPPLDHPLELRWEDSTVHLLDGAEMIASASVARVELAAPSAPTADQADKAGSSFTGFDDHIFPGCFVCGPERSEGDGLRIFPGALKPGVVAARWISPANICGPQALIPSEFIWASLDCPGYFAVAEHSGPAVLGKIAVRIDCEISCAEPLVVTGWHIESSGRKHLAGTALYRNEVPVAIGVATWISLRQLTS